MKIIFSLALLSISLPSFADYFFCKLDYGPFLSTTVEADYRVLEASVKGGTFECEGKITGNKTTVMITSTETGDYAFKTEEHSVASVDLWGLNQWGDGQDHGVCTCGMH